MREAGSEGSGLKVRLSSAWFISVIVQGCISKLSFVNTVDFTALGLEDSSSYACVQLY